MMVKSKALKVLKSNIDTDQIIPARYLTGISKTGLGQYLFEDLPGNPLDAITHEGVEVILTLDNFGCGSSREHAVWAIMDRGFKAVIAVNFARIFEENCYNNAVIPIRLTEAEIKEIASLDEYAEIEIDVNNQVVKAGSKEYKFELDELKKEFILHGGFMKFLDNRVPEIKKWATANSK